MRRAEYNKATVEVKANTDVTLSTIEKQIIIATATATAEATLLSKEAQALAIVKRLAAYKSTIKYAQTVNYSLESLESIVHRYHCGNQ
jgi:hypothetical protein